MEKQTKSFSGSFYSLILLQFNALLARRHRSKKQRSHTLELSFLLIFNFFLLISSAQNVAVNTTGTAAAAANMFEVTQQAGAVNNSVSIFAKNLATATNAYGIWAEATGAANKYAIVVPPGGGSMGIGTITPTQNLHIYSTSAYPTVKVESNQVGGGELWLKGSGPDGHQIYEEGSDLRIWDNADRVTFKAGGNVGIGTTNPGAKLDVNGNGVTGYIGQFIRGLNDNNGGVLIRTNWPLGSVNTLAVEGFSGAPLFYVVASGSTGNVGVGIASPANTLHVDLSSAAGNEVRIDKDVDWIGSGFTQLRLCGKTNPNQMLRIGYSSTGDFAVLQSQIAGAGLFKPIALNPNGGNVGIGTTGPIYKLDVVGDARANSLLINGGGTYTDGCIYSDANWGMLFRPKVAGAIAAYDFQNFGGTADIMTILNNGNVGIHTTNPIAALDVIGNLRVDRSGTPNGQGTYIGWNDNTISVLNGLGLNIAATHFINQRGTGAGGFSFDLFDNSNVLLSTPMYIKSTGQVGIGTVAPNDKLEVVGVTRATGYRCRTGGAGAYGGNVFNLDWTGSVQVWIDNTNVGTIQMTSDRRLKENIAPLENNALSRLMELNPVSFKYKKVSELFTGSSAIYEGFIADELQTVIPSAVNGEKDALTNDGTIQPQTLNLAPIISVLTKAMQEQQKMIEELQKKIERLEKK